MRNVPFVGLLNRPATETGSPVAKPSKTPKMGYTGKQSFYANIDGTLTTDLAEHHAWDKDKLNGAGE